MIELIKLVKDWMLHNECRDIACHVPPILCSVQFFIGYNELKATRRFSQRTPSVSDGLLYESHRTHTRARLYQPSEKQTIASIAGAQYSGFVEITQALSATKRTPLRVLESIDYSSFVSVVSLPPFSAFGAPSNPETLATTAMSSGGSTGFARCI